MAILNNQIVYIYVFIIYTLYIHSCFDNAIRVMCTPGCSLKPKYSVFRAD